VGVMCGGWQVCENVPEIIWNVCAPRTQTKGCPSSEWSHNALVKSGRRRARWLTDNLYLFTVYRCKIDSHTMNPWEDRRFSQKLQWDELYTRNYTAPAHNNNLIHFCRGTTPCVVECSWTNQHRSILQRNFEENGLSCHQVSIKL